MSQDEDLRAADWELLSKHLNFYEKLATGRRKPTTEAQVHFVEVCKGRAEPTTKHEVAYIKYRRGGNAQRSEASQTAGTQGSVESKRQDRPSSDRTRQNKRKPLIDTERDDSIPEYEEGYPDPNWYSGRDRSPLNPYSRKRPRE